MESIHLIRQQDIIAEKNLGTEITVIGAGAIGSMTTLLLAKSGFSNIRVYDADNVDAVNINSQFYRISDIGRKKVDALKDIVREFSGVEINAIPEFWNGETHFGIVVIAVDSMKVRKAIYSAHYSKAFNTWLIDSRMGAETFLIYTYHSMRESKYSNSLYSDEESLQEPCTAKATSYCAGILAGHVAATVKALVCGLTHVKFMQGDIKAGEYQAWNS